MKHCCRNCHFLTKESGIQGGMLSYSLPWTGEERLEGKAAEVYAEGHNICCKRGIWDKRIDPELISKLEEIIDENRAGDCFFIEYREGMSFEGATELHRTRYENRNLRRSFSIAVWGLYLSVIAALLNFIGIENFGKLCKTILAWLSILFNLLA